MAATGPYANHLHLDPDSSTPVPHHIIYYRPDVLPDRQPSVSKHWRQFAIGKQCNLYISYFFQNENSTTAPTWKHLVVERINDCLADVLRLHADEADAATDAVGGAENSGGHDATEVGKHDFQIFLGHLQRQVGNVQIGIVAFLLLQISTSAHN